MKYIIERAIANCPSDGWTRSDTYPNTYTFTQAEKIMKSLHVMYRMVPIGSVREVENPSKIRQVTREEFLDTLVDEAKERLSFDIIHKYLPFATTKRAGYTFNHIVLDSVYPVQTEKRTVRDGETLCGRRSQVFHGDSELGCPGCLAIARELAVRDLT